MIYVCESCKFFFERVNETAQCPNCSKESIRVVTEEEKVQYEKFKQDAAKRE